MSDETGIRCRANGPLLVSGSVSLIRKAAVQSEHGEPLTWKTSKPITDDDTYALCRCGKSGNRPFCDGTHRNEDFIADETAAGNYSERATELGGTGITVRDDRGICAHAGFCGTRVTNIWEQVGETSDSTVRLAVINEVEKCPSGAITYRFDGDDTDTEADYAEQIAVTDDGPLWVTGSIPVTLADGTQLETRSRVTLCRCGASDNKPLCDGSHHQSEFREGNDSW